eukprot:Gb_12969 [translate_table: standard]
MNVIMATSSTPFAIFSQFTPQPFFRRFSQYPSTNILVTSFSISTLRHRSVLLITSIQTSPPPTTHFSTPSTSDLDSQLDLDSSPTHNSSFIQEFLQNSCGLSQNEAKLASKPLLHLKSTKNPEQVVLFFKQCGFTDVHIQNVVTCRPKVLTSSVANTLLPKVRVFESLGIVGKQLGLLISRDPALLATSLEKKILPGISFLQKMLESDDNVVRTVTREPWLLHTDLEKKLEPKLLLLQNHGINRKLLSKILITKPRSLMSAENVLKDLINTVENLGVSPRSSTFASAVFVVSCMHKKTLEHKIDFLVSLGLSREQVLMVFKKAPFVLSSSEDNLRNHMDFLVNTLKYEPSIIVHYPRFLTTSMKSTVMPRYRVLKMLQSMELRKKNFSVISMLSISEKKFLERFVFKYDESSRLYGIYKGIDGTSDSNMKEDECCRETKLK